MPSTGLPSGTMAELTLVEWASVGLAWLLALVATIRIRASTSQASTERARRAMQSWWPFGTRLLSAWIRLGAIATASLWIVPAIVVVGRMKPEVSGGAPWPWQEYLFLGLAGLLAVWVVLMLTVALINWPSVVVPPHLRGDPGILSSARSRRRRSG